MTVRGDFTGTASVWRVHAWRPCPDCRIPCRVSHGTIGTCVTCALPVMREEKTMATNGGAR